MAKIDNAIIKEEPADDNIPDSSSFDILFTVKIEPTDVGEDVDSLDPASTVERELKATIDVKQEMDIDPITLQPPNHLPLRPCKPEPVEEEVSPAQKTIATVTGTTPRRTTQDPPPSTTTSRLGGTRTVEQKSRSYRCGVCNKIFKLEKKLESHVLTIHTDKAQYPCYRCFKYFSRPSQLTQHMLVHTGERPHCCSQCNKSFARKHQLQTHTLTHTGERPYSCSVCKKSFSSKAVLKIHIMSHTDKRPHCCEVCDKSFARKGDLKTHVVTHTGERPHCCSVCNKSFASKAVLKTHIISHAGERMHFCNVCNKSFTRKGNLKRHMLSCIKFLEKWERNSGAQSEIVP